MTIEKKEVISIREFTDEELDIKDNILEAVCTSYNDSIKVLEGKSVKSASDILLSIFMEVSTGIFLHIFNNFPTLREAVGAEGMVNAGIDHLKTRILRELESELH